MKYYLIEIIEPTNRPGTWSRRKIFRSEKQARKFFNKMIKESEDPIELPATEWDDGGPNWRYMEEFDLGDEVITLAVIDN